MNEEIRLGVLIPIAQAQWSEGGGAHGLIDFAVHAERLGYHSLWVNDSLLSPRIEALTMLAAAAPVTERVTLGTAALLPVLRRPVQTAQTLASVDQLSGGRLVVAVGAGFPGRFGRPLYDLSEVPWPDRFTRLDETVALWRQLWTSQNATSFHGKILSFSDIPPALAPCQAGGPPVWLGGASPAALDRTGRRYDGWLPYPPDPADYQAGLAAVRRAGADAGRAADAVTPALFVSVVVTDGLASGRAALDDYARASYGLPLEELEKIQALVAGPAEHVAAELGRYVAAGARHLVCRIGAKDLRAQREQLERIAGLIPTLRQTVSGPRHS